MIDFPAKSQQINGTYIQVFDEDRKDEVTNLRSVSLTIFLIVLKSRNNLQNLASSNISRMQ